MRGAIRVPQASEAHTRAQRKYTHSFPDYHPRYDEVSIATAQLRRRWFRVAMFKFRAELGGPAAPYQQRCGPVPPPGGWLTPP